MDKYNMSPYVNFDTYVTSRHSLALGSFCNRTNGFPCISPESDLPGFCVAKNGYS